MLAASLPHPGSCFKQRLGDLCQFFSYTHRKYINNHTKLDADFIKVNSNVSMSQVKSAAGHQMRRWQKCPAITSSNIFINASFLHDTLVLYFMTLGQGGFQWQWIWINSSHVTSRQPCYDETIKDNLLFYCKPKLFQVYL